MFSPAVHTPDSHGGNETGSVQEVDDGDGAVGGERHDGEEDETEPFFTDVA